MARSPFDGGYPMIGLLSSFAAPALTTNSSDQVSVHAQVSLSSSHCLRAGTDDYNLWETSHNRHISLRLNRPTASGALPSAYTLFGLLP